MPQLPQELIDQIIDCLAANSKIRGSWLGEDLLHCSHTNRSFRHRCLFYLFSSICISGKDLEAKISKIKTLLEIIEEKPIIATYIDELNLASEDMGGPNLAYGPKFYSTLLREPIFATMMEKISPIRHLVVKNNNGKVYSPSKERIDPIPVLDRLLLPVSTYITSLYLQALDNVPLKVLASFPNLNSLDLLNVGLTRINDPMPQSPPTIRHFGYQHCRFSQIGICKIFGLSHMNISQLKSLTIYAIPIINEHENEVDSLFTYGLSTIEELRLFTMDGELMAKGYPSITSYENWFNLRFLHCDIPFKSYLDLDLPLNMLSSIHSGSLDHLEIVVKLQSLRGRQDQCSPEIILNCDWSLLCSQVLRIMDCAGSKFDLQLSFYAVLPITPQEVARHQALFRKRCHSTLSILSRREHFQALVDSPHIKCRMTEAQTIVSCAYAPFPL
ncbi:hypothetical protein JR316_0011008 [Psilocybe cubensis]|uniref:Uncharacterized protein n=2 Tax=Psilocybe cubensis TaxID=181762 RepID=A0A8H7XPM4_PSICU|nr:hypothetical protein JR316_0011008 [Psilocybe cubensis]KAH9477092.1 hypothetical protein JR316_0011008 [Psilocybe cubensis]